MTRPDLDRILAEQREREGPPTEFDHRSCLAVLGLLACFWILAAAIGVSVWDWAFTTMEGTR